MHSYNAYIHSFNKHWEVCTVPTIRLGVYTIRPVQKYPFLEKFNLGRRVIGIEEGEKTYL